MTRKKLPFRPFLMFADGRCIEADVQPTPTIYITDLKHHPPLLHCFYFDRICFFPDFVGAFYFESHVEDYTVPMQEARERIFLRRWGMLEQ